MTPLLAHTLETATEAPPSRWLFFLHGIFGRGSNWRGFAKRLVRAHPDWGAVLVDLRMHGASQGFPPPQTVRAAADDLVALESAIPGPVAGVVGHSFGGKVALAYLAQRGEQLAQTWLLDAMPGPRLDGRGSETILLVLKLLADAPQPVQKRTDLIEWFHAGGIDPGIASWLAMNLESGEGGYRLRMDLPAIRALLDDYFALNLWSVLEAPQGRGQVHVVIGGRSRVFEAGDRERVETLASANPRLLVHVLPNAGHWVHVDDPEGLFALLSGAL